MLNSFEYNGTKACKWFNRVAQVRSQCTSYSEYTREYRAHFVLRALRVLSTDGLNTASTGSMSGTGGPNTASTGSMSSTEPRVQAVPAVSNPEILGVQAVSALQKPEILRVLSVYSAGVLPVLQLPSPEVNCTKSHSWDHL